jgi:hypothetical protein
MDNADLSQLPRPLREAMVRACESVIDLHDVLQQVSPAQPSAPYPRSAMEWLVLAALAAMAPMPATPKQGAEMIHKPHLEVQKILFALEVLGTIYRHTKDYYSTVAPPPLPTDVGRPSALSAARIARIVAQETRHAGEERHRELRMHQHHTDEKGTAHD